MICVVNYNKLPGFEVIHGLLDRIMQVMEIDYRPDDFDKGYHIKSCNGWFTKVHA